MQEPSRLWGVRGRKLPRIFDRWRELGVAAVYWSELKDLATYQDRKAIRQELERRGESRQVAGLHAGELWRFAHEIEPGHWVLTPAKRGRVWVGVVRSRYQYDPSRLGRKAPHLVEVEWLGEVDRAKFPASVRKSLESLLTVFDLSRHIDTAWPILRDIVDGEPSLEKVLEVIQKAEEAKWDKRNEAETRTKVVVPVVEALGWSRWGEWHADYPVFGQEHVDLALKLDDTPVVFIEVKPYAGSFDSGAKWVQEAVKQVVNYAQNHDPPVRWAVLTNGHDWRLFDAHLAELPHHQKLVFALDVAQRSVTTEASVLLLLSRAWLASSRTEGEAFRLRIANAVRAVLRDPPRSVLRAVASAAGQSRVNRATEDVARQELARAAEALGANSEAGS